MITPVTLDELTPKNVSIYGVVRVELDKCLLPEEFLGIAARLGKVVPFGLSKYRPQDFPFELTLLDNFGDGMTAAPRGFGEGWHQDSTFLPRPPEFTILHAMDVPDEGGDTFFADTRPAFFDLSRVDQEALQELELEHSVQDTYRITMADVSRPLKELLQNLPRAKHPAVLQHPRGDSTLCLSPLYTLPVIKPEQRPLFNRALEKVLKGQETHKWKANDILVWDNRVVLHAATHYQGNERRRLVRAVVEDLWVS